LSRGAFRLGFHPLFKTSFLFRWFYIHPLSPRRFLRFRLIVCIKTNTFDYTPVLARLAKILAIKRTVEQTPQYNSHRGLAAGETTFDDLFN
jgi:hypothetical protein